MYVNEDTCNSHDALVSYRKLLTVRSEFGEDIVTHKLPLFIRRNAICFYSEVNWK